jgi:ubiquinone/menaquinone biosynthesis C-methylase UbiE
VSILNLGAGNRIIEGAVNHDRLKHRPEISITHDLDVLPWPWSDSSFDAIQAISVFEHLSITLIQALDECWRILKPGGQLVIKYPIYTTPTAHDDPTHRWHWSEKVLDFVDDTTRYGREAAYYTPRRWHIVSRGLIKERNVKAVLEPVK